MKRLLFCLALALPLSATAGNLPPRAGAQPSAAHAGAAAVLGAHRAEAEAPVDIGLIALNDFHGHLLPPHAAMMAPDGRGGAVAVPAGGAAWLASAVDAARARHPHALTLSAGDILSASPSESALFLDEPAIGVMNRIGLDYNAVGNHEFDRGRAELLRIAHGGCEQTTLRKPCALEPYAGARFPFLAANTLTEDGTPLFPATALRSFGKGARRVRVGIIGLTLRGTGALSSPEGHKGLRWADEADTANALVPQLKAEGADVVVVLIHQGGRTDSAQPDPNGCSGFHGGLKEILDRLDPRVDLVISGHTHWAYVCHYPVAGGAHSLLVTSAGLWGEAITEIDLKVDPARHLLLSAEARNIIVQSDGYGGPRGAANTPLYPRFAPRADIAAYVQRYADAAQKLAGQQVGWLAGPAEKTEGALGSTGGPLGRLIADAQLAATRPAGAEISFMNPFGVRASLLPAGDRAVNWGQLFAVQPFGNDLVTLTLTGAEIRALLEQGFGASGPEQALTPSAGFAYGYDRTRPPGSRIVWATLDGRPLEAARPYRVTVSSFLADGGDSFSLFTQGRNRTIGANDLAALESWLQARPPRALPTDPRDTDLAPATRGNPTPSPPGHHY